MYEQEEPFHSKVSVYQVIENQRRAMLEKIQQLTEQRGKAKSLDDLAQGFAQEFAVEVPVLDETGIEPRRREVDIDLSRDRMRADYGFSYGPQGVVKGTEITISVPFTGDAEVFRIHANSHTMDYPRGQIGRGSIAFTRSGQNLDGIKVRADFDVWLTSIKNHLAGIRRDLGNFNETLKAEAARATKDRLSKFKSDDALLDSLGFAKPKAS